MFKNALIMWLTVGAIALCTGTNAFAQKSKTANNGFDQLCNIYTRVFTEKKYANLTLKQKASKVDSLVHKTMTSVDAIEAYSTIWQVAPKERYKLMRKAAEHSLKRPWECDELKKIFLINTQKTTTRQDSEKEKDRTIDTQ